MHAPRWFRWYADLLRRVAQPRDEAALERHGIRRLVFGYRRAGNGFGALVWGSWAAVFALFSLASLLLGLWWFGLALIPLVAHAGARTIGTYREGHLF